METSSLVRSFAPLLALVAAAACNVTTTGDRGVVTFTPDDCGMAFCSLDQELAAGASIELELGSTRDESLRGLALVSEDPRVAVVFPMPLGRWHVVGTGSGVVHLRVVDRAGIYVDGTDLLVERPRRLALRRLLGSAFTRHVAPGEEIWVAPAARELAFRVRPFDAFGGELMGKLSLETEIESDLFDALDPASRLPEGELSFRPMAPGDYWLTVSLPTVALDVSFEVR
jgi:hypothetical protein